MEKLNENYYAPKGYVEIKDAETGEIICKTHNMIVKDGRTLILNAVFNNSTLEKSNFKRFYEVDNEEITTPTSNYNKDKMKILNDGSENALPKWIRNQDKTFTEQTTNINVTDLCLTFDYKFTFDTDFAKITAIGLLYGTSESNYKLFSRASMDPVYMRNNRVYVAHYTIYF